MGPLAMAAGQAAVSLGSGLLGGLFQQKQNKELAKYQAELNQKYLQQQLEYNTPANQMKRFQEAGLNPNLIYGQGSPGNQSAPLSAPDIKPADFQRISPDLLQLFNQTRLTTSQVQAQNANTNKANVQASLYKMQEAVMRKNPLLDADGFNAIIDGLIATAEIKQSEATESKLRAGWMSERTWVDKGNMTMEMSSRMAQKLDAELNLLNQKFNLGSTDQAIKGQILKSKEFQNAILDVQKRWLTDADVTPQHIYQFIQMLLLKLL